MLNRVIFLAATATFLAINLLAGQAQDETSIREMLRAQTEAWNRGDGIAWARGFADDGEYVNIRGDVLQGRADIEKRVASAFQGRMKGSQLSLTVRQVRLLSSDIALVESDCEIAGLREALPGIAFTQNGVLQMRMKYIAVKHDGHWFFVAAQTTPVLPPQPAFHPTR